MVHIYYQKARIPSFSKMQLEYQHYHAVELEDTEPIVSDTEHMSDSELQYDPFQLSAIQTFNPLYNQLFDLNVNTYDKIMLNHQRRVVGYQTVYDTKTSEILSLSSPVHTKFSPLLDPIHYMTGRYETAQSTTIPQFSGNNYISRHEKISSPMNMAYIDAFFNYLSSKLVEQEGFINGLEFYGTFTGMQRNFKYNIIGDYSEVTKHSHFLRGIQSKLFNINTTDRRARNRSEKRYVSEKCHTYSNIDAELVYEMPTTGSSDKYNNSDDSSIVTNSSVYSNDIISVNSSIHYNKDDPSINSKPCTNGDDASTNGDDVSINGDDASINEYNGQLMDSDFGRFVNDALDKHSNIAYQSTMDDIYNNANPELNVYIANFPVQMICMERCKQTLDQLLQTNDLPECELESMLIQIVMTLAVYQDRFKLTHNDLHTNNIMWSPTDHTHIDYVFNGTRYHVPTFGRVYKIIDFGRSIYSVNGKRFCSDAFASHGDAYGQYNCMPFHDDALPTVEPNYSFDLCLLAYNMFDLVFGNSPGPWMYNARVINNTLTNVQKTILRWGMDSRGKHIAFKQSGDDRYTGFKLYKIIARNACNCIPADEIQTHLHFIQQYVIDNKNDGHTPVVNVCG